MKLLADGLYFVTSGLLIPCIAALLVLLAHSFLTVGRYWGSARREQPAINELVEQLRHWDVKANSVIDTEKLPSRLQLAIADILSARSEAAAGFTLSEFEVLVDKELSRLSHFAKLGPVLGLMGTLIPMGPALQGLANGDIAQLANQMQVAFTTTVVGLLIGAVGFVLYQQRRRMVSRELSVLELLAALRFEAVADE